jgi:hypothetical protein
MANVANELKLSHIREHFISKALQQAESFRHTTSAQNQQLLLTMTAVGQTMGSGRQSGMNRLLQPADSGFSGTPQMSYGLYPPADIPSYGSYSSTNVNRPFRGYQSTLNPMGAAAPTAGAHISEVFATAGGPPPPTPPSTTTGVGLDLLNMKLPPPTE